MLIVFNPPAAAKDRILINPTQVGTVHPVCERRSTVDPGKTVWVLSLDMANGQSHGVAFEHEADARAVEAAFMREMGPLITPSMKA